MGPWCEVPKFSLFASSRHRDVTLKSDSAESFSESYSILNQDKNIKHLPGNESISWSVNPNPADYSGKSELCGDLYVFSFVLFFKSCMRTIWYAFLINCVLLKIFDRFDECDDVFFYVRAATPHVRLNLKSNPQPQ